jgi:hypothetical protein
LPEYNHEASATLALISLIRKPFTLAAKRMVAYTARLLKWSRFSKLSFHDFQREEREERRERRERESFQDIKKEQRIVLGRGPKWAHAVRQSFNRRT